MAVIWKVLHLKGFNMNISTTWAFALKVSRCWIKIVELKLLQKTNEQICFSILTTRKYLKLENEIQVSSISESAG